MQKEVVLGSALVLFGLVVFAGSFILISNSKSLTGKVISEDGFAVGGDEAASSGSNTLAGISTVCSSGCNPDNSLEICSSGNWMRCPSGDVCSLGQCIRPIENSAETRLVVGGTGSSSGGSSGSSSSDAAVAPETINQIGVAQIIDESGEFRSTRKEIASQSESESRSAARRLNTVVDYVLGSVHAVTEDGKVLIASNTGSQLPAYSFAAEHVIWAVGTQKITKDDGEISWKKSPKVIERQIRAFYPWPGSYTFIDNKRLIIHQTHLENNKLVLDIVKPEGKNEMKFSQFLRGFRGKKPKWFSKIKI